MGLGNGKVSPEVIVHSRKNRDVLWLLDQATWLNRKHILDPNVLDVDNRGCMHGRDRRVGDKTNYQQSQTENYELELRN